MAEKKKGGGIKMLKKISGIIILSCFVLLNMGCSQSYDGPPADLVIKNAKIVTIDQENPRAQAIAIKGEKILAVGSNSKFAKFLWTSTGLIVAVWSNSKPRDSISRTAS